MGLLPYTACWALWPNPRNYALPLPRLIDQALSGYLFYPEPEWVKYGYRPPENYPVVGAWRSPEGSVFAFLLGAGSQGPSAQEPGFMLYVTGSRDAVEELGAHVMMLKSSLARSDKKELVVRQSGYKLGLEQKSQAIARLAKLIGLFTVVVNAFSLYLRRLPSPELSSSAVLTAYQILVGAVHFSALALLLMVILAAIGYTVKYALLVYRRL